METTYQPQAIETKWYQFWEQKGFFKAKGDGAPYCIVLPPPNVTGTLHMGHAFQDTIMDTLIRYHRMKGDNTLWQPGTDHAGIATQMVVERQLANEGISKHDIGRDAFIEKVWEWKETSGNAISTQMRRLGTSPDWDRECFTMDDGPTEAVNEVFVRLYDEGLIYKGKRLVNWDPVLKTAISDLEVASKDEKGSMWHIRYPLAGKKDEFITIATTRPETLLGDAAVAVHPEDERYKHLIGEKVQLPLCERLIPVIADDYVDPEFGSGCVKITPAHDFNDNEIGKRHSLAMINILNDDASLNQNVPFAYRNLDRFKARTLLLKDLDKGGFLIKEEDHTLKIPRGDRTGVILEPYLTDQWFVSAKPLAELAIKAVDDKRIEFVPQNWTNTFYDWMNNIQDWCISRQLWWGHQIPAWYDEDGKIYVGRTEKEVRLKYNVGDSLKLSRETDVLDTWFSSALWPFSTMGWPNDTEEFKKFYPTSVLVTGFDIIFFWVARMIMMGLKFTDNIPFQKVFVHGLIQDADGQKMSKSKGNIIDPIDLIDGISLEDLVNKRTGNLMQPQLAKQIEKSTRKHFPDGIPAFGTDALRFTFCALATTGRHIRFDLNRMGGYRNFCNKLWNAARFVLMNEETVPFKNQAPSINLADRWIVSKLQTLKQEVELHINEYRFDLCAKSLYEFTWNQYCDWYVELAKLTLNRDQATQEEKQATLYTMVSVFEELLRILHPLMPFITEEIWTRFNKVMQLQSGEASIMNQAYPVLEKNKVDEEAIEAITLLQSATVGIRNIRAEMNLSPNLAVEVFTKCSNAKERNWLANHQALFCEIAKIKQLTLLENEAAPLSATALAGELELHIPMEGLIDKEAEVRRLERELAKVEKERVKFAKKLENENYVKKAPPEIVQQEKERLSEATSASARLSEQLKKVQSL